MNVAILIATYGSEEWRERGDQAFLDARDSQIGEFTDSVRVHHPLGTLATARNSAAHQTAATWLCFIDADDRLQPGYLAAMSAVRATTPEWSPLLVPSLSIVKDGIPGKPTIPDWDRSIYDLNCAVIGTLVKRDLFYAAGGFQEEAMYEDWSLWLRCIMSGGRMVPVRDAVYLATQPTGDVSRNRQDRELSNRTYSAIRAQHKNVMPDMWRRAKVSE